MRHILALFLAALALPASAAITGSVMTSDGQPVAGARVLIHAIETPEGRRARLLSDSPEFVPIATVQTDARGSFSIPSPKEPVVDLRVEMRGYEPVSRRVERDEDLGAVAIPKREMQRGTITAGGKPVANALVVVSYSGDYIARTDEQGRYEVPEIKRATRITVIHPDYAVDEEVFFFPGSANSGELNRALSSGVTLTGRTVAADGKSPVAKAEISVDGWPLATSGEDGAFTVKHAPPKWTILTAAKDKLAGQRAAGGEKTLTVRMEKAAVVSGRITDAKTKLPVAGATVRLSTARRMMASDPALLALTDAKGAYSMAVSPGSYTISVTHPAYEMQNADVSVTAGQQNAKDLGLAQLARISGVVVDEENRPVAAASITSESSTGDVMRMGMRFMPPSTAVSGPDGKFSLRVQPDAEIRLKTAKRGMPQVKSDALKLAAGERKTALVLTVPTGIAVTGRVLDANGDPLSGVAVMATETPAGDRITLRRMIFTGMPGEEDDAVRSASDGTFTLRVKEGTYDFTFKREGYAQKQVRAQTVTPNGENTIETRLDPAVEISGRVTRGGVGVPDVRVLSFGATDSTASTGPDGSFTLGGLTPGVTRLMLQKDADLINEQRSITAPARDVHIDLPQGGTISGRVVEKGTKKPIPAFQVGLSMSRSAGGMVMMGPPQSRSFTSDDGSFTLEHVPAGAMNVVASAPGYAATRMNVDVQDGKSVTDLVLELESGVRLTGKVTGPNGTPVPDARVVVTPSPTGAFAGRGTIPSTTTDSNGEYVLDGLDPGEETVNVSHPKYVDASRKVTLKGKETKLDMQLGAGLRVTGTVVTEGGMPVADAEVAVTSGMMPRETRTNAAGAFELDGMTPGRYRFSAAKSGYATGVVDDVDISTSGPVRITLKTGGTIYGRVVGLSEADYANTTVMATAGRSQSSAAVDPQGNFRVEGAPVGTVRVWATVSSRAMSGGRTSTPQTVEVAAGSAQQVNIEFRTDTVVRGRVTRNGVPLGGAMVSFFPKQGTLQSSGSATADEQGIYSVSGLEAGEYNVTVRDPQRFTGYATTYSVRGSGTFDIDYRAGSVRGRVLNATSNEPVNGARVELRPTAPDSRMMTFAAATDSTGSFSIELVAPGTYALTAGGEGYANHVADLTVGDAGRDDLEIRLMRNDGVALKVVDARDGRALSGFAIAFDMQGRVVADSRTSMRFGDATGEDLRVPLPPGRYTVTVSAFNYAPRSVSVTSPSTQTVSLTPGGTIRLQSRHSQPRRYRLLDAAGMPYPRYDARPNPSTLLPGTVPLERIAPGSYTIQLVNEDGSVADQVQVLVREGETVEVSI